ncbi:hypothetical protein PFUGPA_01203, partial [Plasmodium falciparum Palo Alto/Uganda]
ENTHKKLSTTTCDIQTTRLLCECELFAPQNYDNDPEMKRVMQQFHDRTTQRFQEYDERLQEKRQICKDTCNKEIQKIILKDKIEKQLAQQFSTLQTNIDSHDIPTCVCEKSIADKVEKGCLRCAQNLGGVAPGWGLLSGFGYVTWSQYISGIAAKAAADAGLKAGVKVGLAKVTEIAIKHLGLQVSEVPTIEMLANMTTGTFINDVSLPGIFKTLNSAMDVKFDIGPYSKFSFRVQNIVQYPSTLRSFSAQAAEVTKAVVDTETGILEEASSITSSLNFAIISSVVAIVVIVLVMIIIYLILRYRRKKKMKKKLQYIKLLK